MRTLLVDLETTPIEGWAWKTYQTDLFHIARDWQIMSLSYKWLDKKKVHFIKPKRRSKEESEKLIKSKGWWEVSLEDYWDFKPMIEELHKIFNEADIIIAHNGKRFDIKKSNAMFLRHGLTPPSSYKVIDTLQVSRQNFNHTSHRLDSLGQLLNIGKKVEHYGFKKFVIECLLENKSRSWRLLRKYNDQDVLLMEQLYYILIPWIKHHPQNLENIDGCPKCGSCNYQSRGFKNTQTSRYRQYQCQDCFGWFYDRKQTKIEKPKFKN